MVRCVGGGRVVVCCGKIVVVGGACGVPYGTGMYVYSKGVLYVSYRVRTVELVPSVVVCEA